MMRRGNPRDCFNDCPGCVTKKRMWQQKSDVTWCKCTIKDLGGWMSWLYEIQNTHLFLHEWQDWKGVCRQICKVSSIGALACLNGTRVVCVLRRSNIPLSCSSRWHLGSTHRRRAKTNKVSTQTLKWPLKYQCWVAPLVLFRSDEFIRSFVGRIGWPLPWNPIESLKLN